MSVLEFMRGRKGAYQIFLSPKGQRVLTDLAVFCRANESAAVPGDDHRTWMAIGRREVWLRIQQHLGLTSEQLVELYSGKTIQQQGGEQ